MQTVTLAVQDIATLNKIHAKIYEKKRLSPDDRSFLDLFLRGLPNAFNLLHEKCPLDEQFEVKVFDVKEMQPHFEKWIALFRGLPKNGNPDYPYAYLFDVEQNTRFWKTSVVIEVAFVPSFEFSKRYDKSSRTIELSLKVDGTASFDLYLISDIEQYPELYNFKGSWKEAYLLVVKTLKQGWPMEEFPDELKPFLKK